MCEFLQPLSLATAQMLGMTKRASNEGRTTARLTKKPHMPLSGLKQSMGTPGNSVLHATNNSCCCGRRTSRSSTSISFSWKRHPLVFDKRQYRSLAAIHQALCTTQIPKMLTWKTAHEAVCCMEQMQHIHEVNAGPSTHLAFPFLIGTEWFCSHTLIFAKQDRCT